jgi:hypothetical protein
MAKLVYVTFEKITGLSGDIEGVFLVDGNPDTRLPLVFEPTVSQSSDIFVFRQEDNYFLLTAVQSSENEGFFNHFKFGMNLLIKSWSYGSGVDTGTKNSN